MAEAAPSPGEWLAPLWRAAEGDWDNAAIHQAILGQCDTPERLAEVARRYRAVADDPERSLVARRQLDAIVGLAFAQLTPRAPTDRRRRWHLLWLFFLLAGVVALARQL